MKKFIILALVAITFCSCGTNTVVTKADITWMSTTGEVIASWENAELQSSVVSSGVSTVDISNPIHSQSVFFEDVNHCTMSISGGMILIENIKCYALNTKADEAFMSKLQSVIDAYYALEDELKLINKDISALPKNDPKLKTLQAKRKDIKKQMRELDSLYFNKTYESIPNRKSSNSN